MPRSTWRAVWALPALLALAGLPACPLRVPPREAPAPPELAEIARLEDVREPGAVRLVALAASPDARVRARALRGRSAACRARRASTP